MFEYITAKPHTTDNREELQKSDLCGCLWCLEIYPASEINQWWGEDENGVEQTAICAQCNADAILGDAAGYPLTKEFLTQMHNYHMEAYKQYTSTELVDEPTIAYLNEHYLGPKGFRVEIGEELEPYTNYFVYEGEDKIFWTIYPNELLIKVAQLLPDSQVHMAEMNIPVGDEMVTQGTLKITVHHQ